MLLSCLMITNSYEKLKNEIIQENYNNHEMKKNISSYFLFCGAIAFFIMELILFTTLLLSQKIAQKLKMH